MVWGGPDRGGGGGGVGEPEPGGDRAGRVGEDGKAQGVLLGGEVVLAAGLGRDGDEEGSAPTNRGVEVAPEFELGDAVGIPAAAEKLDDDGTESEQVGRGDEAVVQIAGA